MFVPLPSENVCDQGSPTAISIAQMVCRTWENLNPERRALIPDTITYNPDGSGRISITHRLFTRAGTKEEVYTQDFTWRLARHEPLGMEDMNYTTLFSTFPKIARSTTAWTYRTWEEGMVPAYIHCQLVGESSFESSLLPPLVDPYMTPEHQDARLPTELLDYIFELAADSSNKATAANIGNTSHRVREICLRKLRRESFKDVADRFGKHGLVMWMTCGHYNPTSQKNPTAFYGVKAGAFKWPEPCGHPRPSDADAGWSYGWREAQTYYSCKLPMPLKENTPFWQRMMSDMAYDAHPDVQKDWTP